MCGHRTLHLKLPLIVVPLFFQHWLLPEEDADLWGFGDPHLTLGRYRGHGSSGFGLVGLMPYFLRWHFIFSVRTNSLPFIRNEPSLLHFTSQLFNFLHFRTKFLQQLHYLISTLLLFLLKPSCFCFQSLQSLPSMISFKHHIHHTLSRRQQAGDFSCLAIPQSSIVQRLGCMNNGGIGFHLNNHISIIHDINLHWVLPCEVNDMLRYGACSKHSNRKRSTISSGNL